MVVPSVVVSSVFFVVGLGDHHHDGSHCSFCPVHGHHPLCPELDNIVHPLLFVVATNGLFTWNLYVTKHIKLDDCVRFQFNHTNITTLSEEDQNYSITPSSHFETLNCEGADPILFDMSSRVKIASQFTNLQQKAI